jgi:uncharacterized tellurite resistance protein B-like protein
MSIASLKGVLKIFGESELTEEERTQLAQEVMLMVLARATAADSNIKNIEIDTVQQIIKSHTGVEFEASEIRVAANSVLFEKAPLQKYVASASRKLAVAERADISVALREVILSDDRISSREIDFFNQIAESLALSPADLVGLVES